MKSELWGQFALGKLDEPHTLASATLSSEPMSPAWIRIPGQSFADCDSSNCIVCIDNSTTRGGSFNSSITRRCTQLSSISASISLAKSHVLVDGAEHATLFFTVDISKLGDARNCLPKLRASARYLICSSNDSLCSVCQFPTAFLTDWLGLTEH